MANLPMLRQQNKTFPIHHHLHRLRQTGSSRWPLLVLLLVLCAALGMVVVKERSLKDWWALKNYQVPQIVSQLATLDGMTAYARKVLYVNHPALDDKATFNTVCPKNGGEQTIVLGCYLSDQAGIYLLNVSEPKLDGVEQVTVAHEMLHAAYDRLSVSDRQKVDTMLLNYYNNGLHDARLLSTIEAYKKSEPNDVVNEMHSVFGTEVANLPNQLEQYYKRYFTDRQQLAKYAANYQQAFTSRQAAVAGYDAQLSNLKAEINSDNADLQAKRNEISTLQSQLLAERSTNVAAYNADVPSYNNHVKAYNAEITTVTNLINQYNQLVAARNTVVLAENQLISDLTANGSPISH